MVNITISLQERYKFGVGSVQIIIKKISPLSTEAEQLVKWAYEECLKSIQNYNPALRIESEKNFNDCIACLRTESLVEDVYFAEGVAVFTVPKKDAKKRLHGIITNIIAGKEACIKTDMYKILSVPTTAH